MIRIIGLGSPFGDDQAGWWVIEELRPRVRPDIDLLALDRPGAALVNRMAGVRQLLVVDAVVDGGPPGRLLRLDRQSIRGETRLHNTHQQALAPTLDLADALGCLPAQVEIFGIVIDPSRAGNRAVRDAATRLAGRLAERFGPAA